MGRIYELDPHIADLIAAGEVVERPASVVKELVENAVDAGATRIAVEIRRGGLAYIRVTDNGEGIEPEDIPTAFLRHATSKVRDAADLDRIMTMGFRGEALASIAAVAKVQVLTRQPGAVEGASYKIAGGVGGEVESIGCPEGTSIIVEELFYNTPARMKFLKKDSSEASRVAAVVSSAALAHPEIAFRFIQDGETELSTHGSGNTASAVYDVLGATFAAGLMPINNRQDGIKVHGFISKPTFGRGNRSKQEFFVNGRPISSKMLSAALEQGYKNSMVQGRFPACVIYLEVSPASVDVNVHPAKTEVKFAFERDAFSAVYMAVRDAIEQGDVRSQIGRARPSFEGDVAGEQQTFGKSTGFVPTIHGKVAVEPPKKHAPEEETESKPTEAQKKDIASAAKEVGEFYESVSDRVARELEENGALDAFKKGTGSKIEFHEPEKKENKDGSEEITIPFGRETVKAMKPVLIDGPELDEPEVIPEKPTAPEPIQERSAGPEMTEIEPEPVPEPPAIPEWRMLGEVFGTYILVEDEGELVFIDKHAAHERIIFDRLVEAGEKPLTQYLISPLVVNLSREDAAAIKENIELVRGLGFEIEHFGGESFAIRALPSELEREDAESTLEQIADDLNNHRRVDMLERREELLRLIACKAAMKAGAITSDAERRALVERVMGYKSVKFCPHGRPVAAVLDRGELERRINRRV